MLTLNLPEYDLKIKSNENKLFIFDIVRKKYVLLTPEEWVRQHFVHYLTKDKKYPLQHIAIEKQIRLNNTLKRFDILVFNQDAKPYIIIECKAPNLQITQEAFDQIARYNLALDATYLVVTNGLQHFYAVTDQQAKQYRFLKELPAHLK